jgi:hypothetical protein
MTAVGQDSLNTRSILKVGDKDYHNSSHARASETLGDVIRLTF